VLIGVLGLGCGLSPLFRGYYDLSVWGPIALGVLAVLFALVVARPVIPRARAAVVLAALAFLCAWSYLSIGWSGSADSALNDANRWLLYTAAFAVFVLLLSARRNATVLIALTACGVLFVALYILATMIFGDGPGLFLARRLNDPLGYINGEAAVLLMGLWPLVAIAERRRPVISPVAIAGATAIACLLVLSQARGIALAAAVSSVIILLVVPGRITRLWVLLVILAGVGVALGPLLDVWRSATGVAPPSGASVRHAGYWALAAALATGLVWGLTIQADRWISPRSPSLRAGLAKATRATLVLVLVAGVAAGLVFANTITRDVKHNFNAFVHLDNPQATSRFLSGGGHRYDYWRIALNEFRDHPVRGVGGGGYERDYFLQRRTLENVTQPHSLELQTLAELGLVGGVALLVLLLAVLTGFVRLARAGRTGAWERAMAVAAGGTFVAWLAHTSVDWLHLLSGVTGIALGSAAVLCIPWPRRAGWSITGRTVAAATVVAVVAATAALGAVMIARPVLAQHAQTQARDLLRSDPRAALRKADQALTLNRDYLAAYYIKSAAYARFDDYRDARAVLLQALRREPRNFITFALLGDLATRRGDRRRALAAYRRASSVSAG
jgi:O-antigen ligase